MTDPSPSKVSSLRFWSKQLFRVLVIALVVWGLWRTTEKAHREFVNQGFEVSDLGAGWMVLAGIVYAIGMFPPCLFWKRTLETMGQQPAWGQVVRAFFVGNLGKYVPGKALVVVLRAGLVKSSRVDGTVAAASVFVETLTFMAVGSTVAALSLLLIFPHLDPRQRLLLGLAIVLALGTAIPTWPPIFRRIVRLLQVHRASPQIDEAVGKIDLRLIGFGWAIVSVGWCLLGASLWATLNAIPHPAVDNGLHNLPLLTAAVALALVAGFLSLIPAGAGVRELVVAILMEPTYGPLLAVAAALLLRVIWLLTEVLLAVVLLLVRPRS